MESDTNLLHTPVTPNVSVISPWFLSISKTLFEHSAMSHVISQLRHWSLSTDNRVRRIANWVIEITPYYMFLNHCTVDGADVDCDGPYVCAEPNYTHTHTQSIQKCKVLQLFRMNNEFSTGKENGSTVNTAMKFESPHESTGFHDYTKLCNYNKCPQGCKVIPNLSSQLCCSIQISQSDTKPLTSCLISLLITDTDT